MKAVVSENLQDRSIILASFDGYDAEEQAAKYISTLPNCERGIYNLDVCRPLEDAHCDNCGCRVITVTYSPWDEDEVPFSYDEEYFISWVDEVFCEGYKHETLCQMSLEDAISLVESNGYTLEVRSV